MSRYGSFNLRAMRDQEVLLAALHECGYTPEVIEVHAQPQTLYGIGNHARDEKAHIIIRRQNTGIGMSNDIGFMRNDDGSYTAIVSEYDQRSLYRNGKPFMQAVEQAYRTINADVQVKQMVSVTIPRMKLRGLIPQNATAHVVTEGTHRKVVLRGRA